MAGFTTRRIGPCFAAEGAGLDLRKPLSPEDVAAVHAAMDEHAVLVFHDQPLDDAEQLAFSRSLGELEDAIGTSLRAPDEYRLPVREECLPERRLDGRRRDVILAAREHERRAPEGRRQLEGVAWAVRGFRLVAHRWVIEHDRFHRRMVGGERDQQPSAHAVADARRARRIGVHPADQVLPRLVHLAEEFRVPVLGL